jgi:hypothetical protein
VGLFSLLVLASGGVPLLKAARPKAATPPAVPAEVKQAGVAALGGGPAGAAPAFAAPTFTASLAGGPGRIGAPERMGVMGPGGGPGDRPAASPAAAPPMVRVLVDRVPLRAALILICDAAQMGFRFEEGAAESAAAPGAPAGADRGKADGEVEAGEEGGELVSLWTGDKPLPVSSVLHRLTEAAPTKRPVRLQAAATPPGAPAPLDGGPSEVVVGSPRRPAPAATPAPPPAGGTATGSTDDGDRGLQRRMAGVVIADGEPVCALIETRAAGGSGAPYYELARLRRRLSQVSLGAPGIFVSEIRPSGVVARNIRTLLPTRIPFTGPDGAVPPALAAVLGGAGMSAVRPAVVPESDIQGIAAGYSGAFPFGSGGGFGGGDGRPASVGMGGQFVPRQ